MNTSTTHVDFDEVRKNPLVHTEDLTPEQKEESFVVDSTVTFDTFITSSVRIIYNPYNIDSCLATTIAIERLLEYNRKAYIETIPQEVFHQINTIPKQCNTLMIMGVNLSVADILREIDKCTPLRVYNFKYNNADELLVDPSDSTVVYREITPIMNIHTSNLDRSNLTIEDISDNCISVLVNDSLMEMGLGKPCTEHQLRLISVTCRYINLEKFDSIFSKSESGKLIKRYNDDLAYLYRNIEGIRKAAANGKPYGILMFGVEKPVDYSEPIKQIRNIINRNMVTRIYQNKQKWCRIPTVCVSEENALEVMRQMTHTMPTAISYEDIQYFRIWRVYSKDAEVIQHLCDVIKPIHTWVSCKITYMVSDNQIITQQIY